MKERGVIVAVRPGEVDVQMHPSEACSECGACSTADNKMMLEGLVTDLVVSPGDVVEVDIPGAARSRARVLVFVIPVLALLLGYLAGFLLGTTVGIAADTLGAIMALTWGIIAMLAVGRAGARALSDKRYEVRVRAIIAGATAPPGKDGVDSCPDPPDRGGPDRE